MATKEIRYGPKGKYETGKWRARVKEDQQENFLGIYDTREEALEREREFRDGKS